MNNIEELIGVLKGINFDEIINEKEITYLKNWVSRNQYLVYEKNDIEFVEIVKGIILDGRIDLYEREQILQLIDNYDMASDPMVKSLYELIGILDGIICDEILNEKEINNLKAWVAKNNIYLEDGKFSILFSEVKEFVENLKTDSENSRNKLLQEINELIISTKLNLKINILCDKVKDREMIGLDLIGILENKNFIDEINERAEHLIIKALNSYSRTIQNSEIIVVALVISAMVDYNGNFYNSVRRSFPNAYAKFKRNVIEGYIRELLDRFRVKNESDKNERNINVAIESSLVPRQFLPKFFEFIYDIYKINFGYKLSNDIYNDFLFVYKDLHNYFSPNYECNFTNTTKKTYKLIESSKQIIIKGDNLTDLINLSIIVARLIDARYWNKGLTLENPYLKFGFDEWISQASCEFGHPDNSKVLSKSDIKFLLDNGSVYLLPQPHNINSQCDYKNIKILLKNDDKIIYENNSYHIKEIIGGYKIIQDKIPVNEVLGRLRYQVAVGDAIIYDSADRLFRNYIVFDSNGNEIRNNTDYEGSIVIWARNGDCLPGDNKLCYNLLHVSVKKGESIPIENEIFTFSKVAKSGVYGVAYKDYYIKRESKDEEIQIYAYIESFSFETIGEAGSIEIKLNNCVQDINAIKHIVENIGNKVKYIFWYKIDKVGFYELTVDKIDEGYRQKVLKSRFVIDNNFEKTIVEEATERGKFNIQISSSFIGSNISKVVSLNDEVINSIEFTRNGIIYNYIIPLPIKVYKVNNGPWEWHKRDIWYEDLSSDSKISIIHSLCNTLTIHDSKGKILGGQIDLKQCGNEKIAYIGFLNNYQSNHDYVTLSFRNNDKPEFTVKCYFKTVILEKDIEFEKIDDTNDVNVCIRYHGSNEVYLGVFDSEGNEVINNVLVENEKNNLVKNLVSFREYKFVVFEEEKSLLGNERRVIKEISYFYYNKLDFVGNCLRIGVAYFNQKTRMGFETKSYIFNKMYLIFDKVIDANCYEGRVIVKTYKHEFALRNINPVLIYINEEKPWGLLDASIVNKEHGDGLLIDFDKRGIMDSLDDPKAPDITNYTIYARES